MKIFPVSDMHLEFYRQPLPPYRGVADVVVCAGDIHTQGRAPELLRAMYDRQEIIYITGNHEYYGSSIAEQDELLREECKKYGIHFLQRDTVEIAGVVFAGCTLWTDFKLFGAKREAEAIIEVRRCLRDYHVISFDKKKMRVIEPTDTREIHRKDMVWLHEQLVQKPEKLVIVTHHGPSMKSLHPAYTEDIVSCGFASALDDLVAESRASYWISGHSHCAQNFKIGQTHVYQNCMGYPMERIDGFDPWLILEI